jgi:hypothetical protein
MSRDAVDGVLPISSNTLHFVPASSPVTTERTDA